MGCRSNESFIHRLAKRLHTHHGAQRCSAHHRTRSPRCSCRGSTGTSNRLSPGRHTHSHDGARCSWLLHQPVHDLENSISPEPALGSVEATTDYASAVVGRESANHTRCYHSFSCLGRILLPSLHLSLGRIEKFRVIEFEQVWLSIWRRRHFRSIAPSSFRQEECIKPGGSGGPLYPCLSSTRSLIR